MKLSIRKSLHHHQHQFSSHDISIEELQNVQSEIVYTEESPYTWPICISPLLYSILILILMIQVYNHNELKVDPSGASSTLKTVQENLAQSPILDISNTIQINRLHRHYQSCPYGYSIATMGNWQGVNSGCLCEDGRIQPRQYCFTHMGSDCKSVPYQGKYKFENWKGDMFCIKKAKNWKWVGNQNCQDGFQKCNGDICISTQDECPITDLIQGTSKNKQIVKIGSKYFNKLRNGSAPLINFEIIPGVHPNTLCFNSKVLPSFQSGKYYPLAAVPEKGCDVYGNTFNYSKILDSDYQLNVYDDNAFTEYYSIPYFLDYIDSIDTYTLQIMSRITINSTSSECQIVNSDSIKKMRFQSEIINSYTHYVCKISLVLSSVLLITSIIFYLTRSLKIRSLDCTNFNQVEYQLGIVIMIALSNLALGIIYFTQADGLQGIDGQNRIFHEYQKYNCFTDEGIILAVQKVIQFAEYSYKSTEIFVKASFYISITFVIFIITLLFLQYKKLQMFFVKPWEQ